MGERGARNEPATPDDIAAMAAIVKEAIQAGALGFSTSRTIAHRAIDGEPVPGTYAAEDELFGIGRRAGRARHRRVRAGPHRRRGRGHRRADDRGGMDAQAGRRHPAAGHLRHAPGRHRARAVAGDARRVGGRPGERSPALPPGRRPPDGPAVGLRHHVLVHRRRARLPGARWAFLRREGGVPAHPRGSRGRRGLGARRGHRGPARPRRRAHLPAGRPARLRARTRCDSLAAVAARSAAAR